MKKAANDDLYHNKVYVVGGGYAYERMFKQAGFALAASMQESDLLCFTGGADVSPELYGEENVGSYCSSERDKYEEQVFDWAYAHDVPMVGICRGGQFLNVMNGGKMWQDVDNHAISGTHKAMCKYWGEIMVSSTHHQMMRPAESGEVLVSAELAGYKLNASGFMECEEEPLGDDCEVVYYSYTKSLCYQPHPEIVNEDHQCRKHFMMLVDKLLSGDL
jgi:hypothetical protein